MEDHAVVEAAFGERDEVAGGERTEVGLDLDDDVPLRRSRSSPRASRRRAAARAGPSGSSSAAATVDEPGGGLRCRRTPGRPTRAPRTRRRLGGATAIRRARRHGERQRQAAVAAWARRMRVVVMRRPPGLRDSRSLRTGGPRRGSRRRHRCRARAGARRDRGPRRRRGSPHRTTERARPSAASGSEPPWVSTKRATPVADQLS